MNGLGGVGVCFENGFGVAKNIPTAVSYYKRQLKKVMTTQHIVYIYYIVMATV